MIRLPRSVLALAVIPLVVVLGFQSAWAFACAKTAMATDRCCCASKRDAVRSDDRGDGLRFENQDCCRVAAHQVQSAPVAREAERSGFEFVPPIAVTTPISIEPPSFERGRIAVKLARPPPARVAIYLDKHALLR